MDGEQPFREGLGDAGGCKIGHRPVKSRHGTKGMRTVGCQRHWTALLSTGAQGPETWHCSPSTPALLCNVTTRSVSGCREVVEGSRVAVVTGSRGGRVAERQNNQAVLGWLPTQLLVH